MTRGAGGASIRINMHFGPLVQLPTWMHPRSLQKQATRGFADLHLSPQRPPIRLPVLDLVRHTSRNATFTIIPVGWDGALGGGERVLKIGTILYRQTMDVYAGCPRQGKHGSPHSGVSAESSLNNQLGRIGTWIRQPRRSADNPTESAAGDTH